MSTPADSPYFKRYHRRVLRPLAWWLGLVLILFLIRTHQRLSERTRLYFEASLAGENITYAVSATVDRRPIDYGGRLPIGWHKIQIQHPKADPFETNAFFWYGRHDLGRTVLNRSKSKLVLSIQPSAKRLTILGPEFSLTLNDSSGMTSSVPTDDYSVTAEFKHSTMAETVPVLRGLSAVRSFTPKLGRIAISCLQTDASFTLANRKERFGAGNLPAVLDQIPEGNYQLTVRHHGNEMVTNVAITAFVTNAVQLGFQYGAVTLQTQPAGARVTRDGRELGMTPLTILEQLPGRREYLIVRNDFEPAAIELVVNAGQTNQFETNLLSTRYVLAMQTAQAKFRAEQYADAWTFATRALEHKPEDAAATELVRKALGLGLVVRAREKGIRGDFADAIKDLKASLVALPDNEDAKTLLKDYSQREADRLAAEEKRAAELAEEQRKKQEAEEAKRRTKAKVRQLHEAFDFYVTGVVILEDAGKFQMQQLATAKPIESAMAAIKSAFAGVNPPFQIVDGERIVQGVPAILFRQTLGLSYRECLIIAGQVNGGETHVLFKVLEYDHPPQISLLGGIIQGGITRRDVDGRVAAEFAKQKAEGLPLVKEKLRRALEN